MNSLEITKWLVHNIENIINFVLTMFILKAQMIIVEKFKKLFTFIRIFELQWK